MLIGKVVLRHN